MNGDNPSHIRVFKTSNCTGDFTLGTVAEFTGAGITMSVSDNSNTDFSAKAVDAAGNVSTGCSNSINYIEDSITPDAPTPSESDPASPANNNSPKIKGAAEAGSTVRLYSTADCTGPQLQSGSAATFNSPGLTINVADDSTTVIRAIATDAAGNPSNCSPTSITYVEDSSNPGAPTLTDTDPNSPANDNNPEIKGTAEAGSTVRLYTTDDCSGGAVATGPAADFTSGGLTAPVANDTTTTFRARLTDAADNVSACSASSIVYTEDSIGPAAPAITGTDPGSPANDNSPRVKGTTGAGAPAQVQLYDNNDCSGAADATGTVAAFTGSGIAVAVPNDSTTQLSARTADAAGNESACSNSVGYVEDSTAPAIDIATPAPGAVFSQNQSVPADFSCTDTGGSGIAAGDDGCRGTVADGAAVDTVTLGQRSFVATARDNAGNTSEATRQYTVIPTSDMTLACAPAAILVNQTSECVVTVRNASASASNPTGAVELTSSAGGDPAGCTLAQTVPGAAACEIDYKPPSVGTGSHELTARYAGDADHSPDSATATVDVAEVSVNNNSTLSFTDGTGTLTITCPPDGGTCEGTVEIRSGAAPSGKLTAAQAKRTVLGKGKFKVRRGRKGNVKVKLTRSARAQLKKRKKQKAHGVIKTKGPNGKSVTATFGVNLKHGR